MVPPESDPLESAIDGIKSQAVQQTLRARASGATDEDKAKILRLAQDIRAGQGGLGWPVVAVCVVGLGLLIWFLSTTSDTSALTDVSAGRPILMLIVILTTVVFGGMMLNAALFGTATEEDAAQRFQRGREVFLVFSGICATVVGFYFGSGTVNAPSPDDASLHTSLGADGTITATVTDGSPPHTVALLKDGESFPFAGVADDSSKFTLAVDETVCPADGNYQVTGTNAGAYPPLAVTFSSDELARSNWSQCGDGDASAADEPGAAQPEETPPPTP